MSEISSEYAKALFMLGMEKGCSKDYKDALEMVSGVFDENPVYKDFLFTFGIPLDERLGALEDAFSKDIPREVLSFLKLLCETKHIDEISECVAQYMAMYDEMEKISKAKVTSAVELTQKEKDDLKEKLEKKSGRKMVMEYIVDASILGGLIVETDGKIMDTSLKEHLKELKDVIKR